MVCGPKGPSQPGRTGARSSVPEFFGAREARGRRRPRSRRGQAIDLAPASTGSGLACGGREDTAERCGGDDVADSSLHAARSLRAAQSDPDFRSAGAFACRPPEEVRIELPVGGAEFAPFTWSEIDPPEPEEGACELVHEPTAAFVPRHEA